MRTCSARCFFFFSFFDESRSGPSSWAGIGGLGTCIAEANVDTFTLFQAAYDNDHGIA